MITLDYKGNQLPRALGIMGVVPFIVLGLLAHVPWTHQAGVQAALINFGAVSLAFVGALHWGLAMRQEGTVVASRAYFWSVVPPAIAWVALMFPPIGSVLILILGLWTHLLQDSLVMRQLAAPDWYVPLRLQLTVGATAGLAIALPPIWSM